METLETNRKLGCEFRVGVWRKSEAGFVQEPEVRTRQYVKAKNLVRDLEIIGMREGISGHGLIIKMMIYYA